MITHRLDLFRLPPGFRGRSGLWCQLWWIVQACLFNSSPQFMYGWRNFLLRCFRARIGSNVIIRPSVRVTYPWKLTVGDHSWIGDHVELYTLGTITIGAHVVISQRSYLCTGSHDFNSHDFAIYEKPIVVEDGAWIAADVFVGPGVTVHRNAVIGARGSVFSDVQADYLYLGSPARPIRPRAIADQQLTK